MFSRTLATTSLLAGSIALTGHAQTAPRYYVGAGATLSTNAPFGSGRASGLYGPALTAGLQLTPHVELQTGVSYQWKDESYSDAGVGVSYHSDYHYKYVLVPVLLRYTFAPAAERFHFDALGGVTLLRYTVKGSYSAFPSSAGSSGDIKEASTKASLTLGPAVRYAVSPHLDVTANALVNVGLGQDYYYSFTNRLFLNASVGVQYTFGQL
jgi:hypothetical protein